MAITPYKGKKICNGKMREVEDFLTVEQALQISLNGAAYTVTMQTPGNEKELVRGLLYTENVYTDLKIHPITTVTGNSPEGYVSSMDVTINAGKLGKGAETIRNIMSVSSCGLCGKAELDDVHAGVIIACDDILESPVVGRMFNKMNSGQSIFIKSGGAHACAAFTADGKLLAMHEDIGRHNAVDKVIGDLLLQGKLHEARCLTVSGRISYEIVNKCYSAGIPFLAAVSAPSSMAVDMAEEKGITLMGFCREEKFTVYSCKARVIIPEGTEVKTCEGQ